MLSMQQQAFQIALKEIGVSEVQGSGNNPRIIEYHQTCLLKATSDSCPWCSAFVNWAITKAGGIGTNSASARSWLLWGSPVANPVPGDIVVLSRGNDGISGHVGFLVETPKVYLPYIKLLSGNVKDQVCIANFNKFKVLGYRRI